MNPRCPGTRVLLEAALHGRLFLWESGKPTLHVREQQACQFGNFGLKKVAAFTPRNSERKGRSYLPGCFSVQGRICLVQETHGVGGPGRQLESAAAPPETSARDIHRRSAAPWRCSTMAPGASRWGLNHPGGKRQCLSSDRGVWPRRGEA